MTYDVDFLRQFGRKLDYAALDPTTELGRRYYVPLHDVAEIERLRIAIRNAPTQTVQALTGPSGSGKTTELKRLQQQLENEGFHVCYVDALEYLSATAPVGIVDFLIAVALGITDCSVDEADKPGRLADLWDAIKRVRVKVDKVGFHIDQVAELDLKFELRGNDDFVKGLRKEVEPNLAAFTRTVREYIAKLVKATDKPWVVIVDQTEKISGTEQVHGSIRDLFVQHGGKLRLDGAHAVYTLPPYLPLVAPGIANSFDAPIRHVLTLKLRERKTREVAEENVAKIIDVIAEREADWQRLFSREQLRDLVLASGGHLRDLFLLIREVLNEVEIRQTSMPLTDDGPINEAIAAVRGQFGLITSEAGDLLRAIVENHGLFEPDKADVLTVANLLQTHVLLVHKNGEWWWEVHPLALPSLNR
jgi:energy-coupling factor transporter ATP-binding protein EcfA2